MLGHSGVNEVPFSAWGADDEVCDDADDDQGNDDLEQGFH